MNNYLIAGLRATDRFVMPVISMCTCMRALPVHVHTHLAVFVFACVFVYLCACVLEGGGGFIINQDPSLSVRAAHIPWLNDWKWGVIMGCQSSPWHPLCSSISWVHVLPLCCTTPRLLSLTIITYFTYIWVPHYTTTSPLFHHQTNLKSWN